MLDIQRDADQGAPRLKLTGRLDTSTAPQLEEALKPLETAPNLILDFAGLSYLSSAGLRVLLSAQKRALEAGLTLRLRNVDEVIMEILEMTGFSDVLTLE